MAVNYLYYGFKKWGDLFNSRQKLALITFVEKVREAYRGIRDSVLGVREGNKTNPQSPIPNPEEYAKAVVSYLALGVDKICDYCNVLCQWRNNLETVGHVFARQALPMLWDYVEGNPITGASGTWKGSVEWIATTLEICTNFSSASSNVTQSSATSLPYPDNYFDAIFTDPPYYDNVPYSYLSDFFYVWLKRTVGDLYLYPELFSTPLTPKGQEIVAYSNIEACPEQSRRSGFEAGKKYFEDMLKKAFQEIHRVLKPDGIAVIVYAHKSAEGWETLVNSLLDSGLIMTGAWPLHTEMGARLNAKETASLASSGFILLPERWSVNLLVSIMR